MYCSVYYIIIALFSHKNRAEYSNAFHDNRHIISEIITNNHHTCEIIDFISGGKINKSLYFV